MGHVACMEEFRNVYRMSLATLKERDLSISGRIIVKWM